MKKITSRQLLLPIDTQNNPLFPGVSEKILNFREYKAKLDRATATQEREQIVSKILKEAESIKWLYTEEIKEG